MSHKWGKLEKARAFCLRIFIFRPSGLCFLLFLMNKTNRCTEFEFYCYYDCTCFGQPFCPSSGVLSRTSALVHFMQLWWPFADRSRKEMLFSSIQLIWQNISRCFRNLSILKWETLCCVWFQDLSSFKSEFLVQFVT